MNPFRRRKQRQREQAKQAHRVGVAAETLNARSLALEALHEADHPETVARILTALEHLDDALALLKDRIPSDHRITEAIAAQPPRI